VWAMCSLLGVCGSEHVRHATHLWLWRTSAARSSPSCEPSAGRREARSSGVARSSTWLGLGLGLWLGLGLGLGLMLG
jgi:hypothetical protein